MNDLDNLILNLASQNTPINKIKEETGLYNSQLLLHLKSLRNKGYDIQKVLKADGLYISLNKNISFDDFLNIQTDSNHFSFIAISDTHIGHIDDNLEAINKVYDYAKNNEIIHIFHAGDMIEGIYNGNSDHENEYCNVDFTKQDDILKQMEYFIKYYPQRENIVTSYILGNHEIHNLKADGIDVSNIIENKRYSDMYKLGYFLKNIRINGKKILLVHNHMTVQHKAGINFNIYDLVIKGHYHTSSIEQEGNRVIVDMPHLFFGPNPISAFQFDMYFNSSDDSKNYLSIKPLVIEKNVYPITEYKKLWKKKNN